MKEISIESLETIHTSDLINKIREILKIVEDLLIIYNKEKLGILCLNKT